MRPLLLPLLSLGTKNVCESAFYRRSEPSDGFWRHPASGIANVVVEAAAAAGSVGVV